MIITAQLVTVGRIDPGTFIKNLVICFVMSTVLGSIVPVPRITEWVSRRFQTTPDTWKHLLILDLIVNTIFSVILGLSMSIFNVSITAGRPLSEAFVGFVRSFLPIYIVSYIIVLFAMKFLEF